MTTLDKYSEPNKLLEIPQEKLPANLQVKILPECQPVCQVPSQLERKEGTQLNCQRYLQSPSQGIKQLMCQIDPIMNPRGFTIDTPMIIPARDPNIKSNTAPGFGDSDGYPSGSPSDNQTKYSSPV